MSAKREQLLLRWRTKSSPTPRTAGTAAVTLPHFDGGEIPQFITFRLADSMPEVLLERWREELASEQNINVDAALRKRIELFLDQGKVMGNVF